MQEKIRETKIIFLSFYKGSLERRDKRSSWAASSSTSMASTATLIPSEANKENDVGSMLDSFPPVTLTGNFFLTC